MAYNGVISDKWGDFLFMCQLEGFICMCQMGRLKSFCQMGRLKPFCQMGRLKSFCQMGRLILLCQLGRYPDHGLVAFHASALTFCVSFKKKRKENIELVFVSFSTIWSDEYFKLKRNVLAKFLDNGCIFLFDVVIYY